jgi:IS5 family transposase
MMSFIMDFSLPEMYETICPMDNLPEIDLLTDCESLKSLIRSVFHNDTERGGRPNFDGIVMIKAPFLKGIYNIVDEKLEKELYDRISFQNFPHYPDEMPDARTLWALHERMSAAGMDKRIRSEIWRQLESHGIVIMKGVIQEVSFITADHGKHGTKKPPAPDMPEPSETPHHQWT